MESQSNQKKSRPVKNIEDKLLSVPGVKEAVEMVRHYALDGAEKDAEFRYFIANLHADHKKVTLYDSSIDYDLADEFLESLAFTANQKIADIWNLSEGAANKLADIIYWGKRDSNDSVEDPLTRAFFRLPFNIVVNSKDMQAEHTLGRKEYESMTRTTCFISRRKMMRGHIYLDVTDMPYDILRLAYGSICLCRRYLGLQKEDLREGAPENIDTGKALKCAGLADSGMPSKKIAAKLSFTIYSRDNPSGTYPQFRKYLKRGRDIRKKLDSLDSFLRDTVDSLLAGHALTDQHGTTA